MNISDNLLSKYVNVLCRGTKIPLIYPRQNNNIIGCKDLSNVVCKSLVWPLYAFIIETMIHVLTLLSFSLYPFK